MHRGKSFVVISTCSVFKEKKDICMNNFYTVVLFNPLSVFKEFKVHGELVYVSQRSHDEEY